MEKYIIFVNSSDITVRYGKKTVQLDTLFAVLDVLNIQMAFLGPLMYQFDKNEKS
jgi:hypothetical protein